MVACNADRSHGIVAIILAAGISSRMGTQKALLQLGGETFLEKVVKAFITASVSDIKIVTGYERSSLEPLIARLPVQEIVNPKFLDGMYSSVQAGVASVQPDVAGFFIHPVDIPLISPQTIRILMKTPNFDSFHIVSPEFEGKTGHPPLIGRFFRDRILNTYPPTGLAGFLQNYKDAIITIQVKDSGIRMNMNTPGDYQLLQDYYDQTQLIAEMRDERP